MAHEKTKTDVISTLAGSPRAWHQLDVRHVAGLPWSALWGLVGLATDSLREVLLQDALRPEYASLLRADAHKLIISESRGQIHDVVGRDWHPHGIEQWTQHIEHVVSHLRQITGAPCDVASIGTVDSGRKMFVSVETPLGFGQKDGETKVYFSFLGSAKEGFSTKCVLDATVVVCGNTYGFVDRSQSPIQWSLSHRSKWTTDATTEVKGMITAAQGGVERRIASDSLLTTTPMDRTEQFGLLALVLAATEANQPLIGQYVRDSGINLADVLVRTTAEKPLLRAVDTLAERISHGDLGPESRVYRDHVEYLVSQPGEWGDTAKRVESAITYGHTQRGHDSNATSRANRHYFGAARAQAQQALDICVAYAAQRSGRDILEQSLSLGVGA